MRTLMGARLGVSEKLPFNPVGATEGIEEQSLRLRQNGGHRQQERMISQKRRTLDRAVHNSYQAAEIEPVGTINIRHRALINPNVTKPDYDDKVLSVGYECGYKTGDVIEWHRRRLDGTPDISYWLIYLQDLTELAYFKGDIRRCSYWVNWRDEKGELMSAWMALRGPVETSINSIQKSNNSIDTPNHSLHILMPKNEATLKQFQRYGKFYIAGTDDATSKICWRIEATDTLSMPGVLELTAVEYYANEHEDNIDKGLVGELIVNQIEVEKFSSIEGKSYIKPMQEVVYTYTGTDAGEWSIIESVPVTFSADGNTIALKWTKTYSGTFTLAFGDAQKSIKVESFF